MLTSANLRRKLISAVCVWSNLDATKRCLIAEWYILRAYHFTSTYFEYSFFRPKFVWHLAMALGVVYVLACLQNHINKWTLIAHFLSMKWREMLFTRENLLQKCIEREKLSSFCCQSHYHSSLFVNAIECTVHTFVIAVEGAKITPFYVHIVKSCVMNIIVGFFHASLHCYSQKDISEDL